MTIVLEKNNTFSTDAYPVFVLLHDNWDDYSTKCKFYLSYAKSKTNISEIGYIKILQADTLKTKLDDSFEALPEDYISLGQSVNFYEKLLEECGVDTAVDFLVAIRDISWNPSLAIPFETTSPFRNALLRSNSAHKARRFGRVVMVGETVSESFSFEYTCQIEGAENFCEVEIDFDAEDKVPGRIVAIIGRNATGKTRFLAQLSRDLAKIRKHSLESERAIKKSFSPQMPIFNRVLALSFSAFDRFSRPSLEQTSYVYCGIRNEKGALSRKDLQNRFLENYSRIKDAGNLLEWKDHIQDILGETSNVFSKAELSNIINEADKSNLLDLLSSGQSILVHAITSLLAWIEPQSIVLFDEPETHLHPHAVANLFNVLNSILKIYDSYAIIATHSPLVVQEVPSKRVVLFDRERNQTLVKTVDMETFGENLSELTRQVFDTVEIKSYYKEVLRRMSKNSDFEKVLGQFDNNLSMSAQSFLLSQYSIKNNENS